jgi:hypothetical protein
LDEVHGAVEGDGLDGTVVGVDQGSKGTGGGCADLFGLVEASQPYEGVGHAEVGGDDVERAPGLLGSGDGAVRRDPCCVGVILARERCCSRLVRARSKVVDSVDVLLNHNVSCGDLEPR